MEKKIILYAKDCVKIENKIYFNRAEILSDDCPVLRFYHIKYKNTML